MYIVQSAIYFTQCIVHTVAYHNLTNRRRRYIYNAFIRNCNFAINYHVINVVKKLSDFPCIHQFGYFSFVSSILDLSNNCKYLTVVFFSEMYAKRILTPTQRNDDILAPKTKKFKKDSC